MNPYLTGIGSRHTVVDPVPDLWLDSWEVQILKDDSRGSDMALVTLVNYPPGGGLSSETIVCYNTSDPYTGLYRAMRISGKPWKIRRRKLILRYRLRKIQDKELTSDERQ